LLSFTVIAANTVAASPKVANTSIKKSHSSLFVSLLLILVVLAAAGWYGWKWWSKKKIDKPDLPAAH
jgi:predicted negative regulator of RcsB-dependent stress response